MVSGQRVLVVDGLPETATVLRAVLEPRGLQVDRLRSRDPQPVAPGPPRADRTPTDTVPDPAVVVLHADDAAAARPVPGTRWAGTPRVIIGSVDVDEPEGQGARHTCRLPHPFDYRDLLGAIDRLLRDAA